MLGEEDHKERCEENISDRSDEREACDDSLLIRPDPAKADSGFSKPSDQDERVVLSGILSDEPITEREKENRDPEELAIERSDRGVCTA